jgi:DNA polymerase-3 subunit delta'
MSWNLIGHTWADKILKQHLKNGDLHHAYLFVGAPGVGRRSLALEFAQAINCTQLPSPGEACGTCSICKQIARMQQADLHIVAPEVDGGMIKVDQIRELQRSLVLSPYEARYRVALLLNFHRANANAQNALLKTLEEAPDKVILMLTADSAESLLPTISSRCEILRLRPSGIDSLAAALEERFQVPPQKAAAYAHLANGRPGMAIRLIEDNNIQQERTDHLDEFQKLFDCSIREKLLYSEQLAKNRDSLRPIIETWISFLRDILLVQQGRPTHIVNTDRAQEINACARKFTNTRLLETLDRFVQALDLLQMNANPRLLLDNLFLQLPVFS